jgi:hypothetical protein
MAQSTLIFEDNAERGVEMAMNIPDIDEQTEYTGALHMAFLLSYIVEKGYHKQFEAEYLEEAQHVQAEAAKQ